LRAGAAGVCAAGDRARAIADLLRPPGAGARHRRAQHRIFLDVQRAGTPFRDDGEELEHQLVRVFEGRLLVGRLGFTADARLPLRGLLPERGAKTALHDVDERFPHAENIARADGN
jgi:hypothetical protein